MHNLIDTHSKVQIIICSALLYCLPLGYASSSAKLNRSHLVREDTTIVEKYGQLHVEGNYILDQSNNPVSLRGMSLFWSQWMGRFYNDSCMNWLRDDWECTVVRAAMGIEMGGYLQNPEMEKAKIFTVIDACIDLGIYVIVDWHDHNAHNHLQQSKEFFAEIATLYGNYPNLIYEIYNEPTQVSWTNVVKPYAEAVIDTIRLIDPDNIVIVGTPTWSQDVDSASLNPLNFDNVVYALHFYAATHKQALRDKAITALNNGIALFVSEWGTCEATGGGFLDSVEVENWINFLEPRKISWCNWSISDANETSAALKVGAGSYGGWPDSMLTPSGTLVRNLIRMFNNPTEVETGFLEYPLEFELYQNYPNPFNPTTKIGFRIDRRSFTTLKIFDLLGNEIAAPFSEEKLAGSYEINFNGTGLPSGMYFYTLSSRSHLLVRKMVLIK